MAAPSVSQRQPIYIVEMMERLGIEPGGGAVPRLALSYATALQRCEACQSKQACRDWLDRMPQSVVAAPRFCPSADILFELQVGQPRLNRSFSHTESDYKRDNHAHIADLERLEDELDELLIQKSTDDPLIADLKRRKLHLRDEIEWLRHDAGAKSRPN
jgi:hypothetical protein